MADTELLARLLPIAVGFMEGGDDLTVDKHGDIVHEYLRGQAELICESVGLSMDHKGTLMWLIAGLAGCDFTHEQRVGA